MTRAVLVSVGAIGFAAGLVVWSLGGGLTLAFIFPGLAALAMLAMAGLMLVQVFLRPTAEAETAPPEESVPPVLGVAALVLFAWIVPMLGFYVTSVFAFVAIALCAGWPGRRHLFLLPGVALVFAAVVWTTFDRILAVEAPSGILF